MLGGICRWRALKMAIWLQVKVRVHGLGLQPRLYTGSVCDESAAEAAIVVNLIFTYGMRGEGAC